MSKAHPTDAGFDLTARHPYTLKPGERHLVDTEIRVDIPVGHVGLLCSRSGLALRHGVIVLNSPGIIDSGYKGNVGAILYNAGDEDFNIIAGDRIAQLVVVPLSAWVPGLSSERGDGGFGSTGVAGTGVLPVINA